MEGCIEYGVFKAFRLIIDDLLLFCRLFRGGRRKGTKEDEGGEKG